MRKILFVDYAKCTGCQLCVLHCSFRRTQTFNPTRSAIRIVKEEEKGLCIPVMCQHCEEPVCAMVCQRKAISRDKDTGVVAIEGDKCIKGCAVCMKACPFGAPAFDPVSGKVFECDLCGGDPECAKICPMQVIQYLDADHGSGLSRKRHGMKTVTPMRLILAKVPGGEQK